MKIVAIGGGHIGESNYSYDMKEIDEEIVKLSNKENPNFLFIGLASSFADSYYKKLKDIYKDLGCITGKISNKTLTHMEVVEKKIKEADIIYIGGGDTYKLMSDVKKTGMDKMLDEALKRGCVMSGVSAGGIIWCKNGLSDYKILSNESDKFHLIDGLGYLDFTFVPHFSKNDNRKTDLKEIIKDKDVKVLGFDNCTAIVVEDKNVRYIRSQEDRNVYEVSYKNGKYIENKINID